MEMNIGLLLTLDLPGAEDDERKEFNGLLNKNGILKMPGLTTCYTKTFESITWDTAKQEVDKIIKTAKKGSGVSEVHYAFSLSENKIHVSKNIEDILNSKLK